MKPPALSPPAPPATQPPKGMFNATDALNCETTKHWYAFLCSSLITFFVGLLLVLSWRILAWVFCQSYVDKSRRRASGTEASAQQVNVAQGSDRRSGRSPPEANIGWMTEAKDWAGELISGQTTTGRILVRKIYSSDYNYYYLFSIFCQLSDFVFRYSLRHCLSMSASSNLWSAFGI